MAEQAGRAARFPVPWVSDWWPSCESHFRAGINRKGMPFQLNCGGSKNATEAGTSLQSSSLGPPCELAEPSRSWKQASAAMGFVFISYSAFRANKTLLMPTFFLSSFFFSSVSPFLPSLSPYFFFSYCFKPSVLCPCMIHMEGKWTPLRQMSFLELDIECIWV